MHRGLRLRYDCPMTTTRINHRDCYHARTTAARQACRKQQLEWLAAMGQDVVLARVAQREIEMDDAFDGDDETYDPTGEPGMYGGRTDAPIGWGAIGHGEIGYGEL